MNLENNAIFCTCALVLLLAACGGGDDDSATGTDADSDADSDADTDADSDADSDADTDADSDGDTDADTDSACPVFFGATALQGWSENAQDYLWTFEANVWDADGADDVVSVTATLEDPDDGDPLHTVDLEYVDSASTWQGYAPQAETGLDCCQILYGVRFVATDASDCATEHDTTVVNDEP